MKCSRYPHYKGEYMYNLCSVVQIEYFGKPEDCDLVNEDGSLNYDNEFIKMEYGNTESEVM